MMWLDDYVLVDAKDSKRYVKASIESDSIPEQFPEDGTDIEGLAPTDVLTKGSSIFTMDTKDLFCLNSFGEWV